MTLHEISSGLKARGRYALAGHLGTAFGATVTYLLVSFLLIRMVSNVFSGSDVLSFVLYELMTWLILTFAGLFSYGLCRIFMSWQYGQKAEFQDLFAGFHESTNTILEIQAVLSGAEVLALLPSGIAALLYPARLPAGKAQAGAEGLPKDDEGKPGRTVLPVSQLHSAVSSRDPLPVYRRCIRPLLLLLHRGGVLPESHGNPLREL